MARRLRQNNAVIEADRAYTSGPRLARFPAAPDGRERQRRGKRRRRKAEDRAEPGELGNFAGMSREQINRQLSAWAENGLVGLKGGRVTILDRQALIDVAEAW
jgi:CRP-like cAMP-binding protein